MQRLARNGRRYQKPTTHGYPHTRYCLLRAPSIGQNNRRAFLFSLYYVVYSYLEWLLVFVFFVLLCSCLLAKNQNRLRQSGRRATKQHKESYIDKINDRWGLAGGETTLAVDYRTSSDR